MINKLEPPPRLDDYVNRLAAGKIGTIELFRYDPNFVTETICPIQADEVYVLLQITCGGVVGQAELHLPGIHPNFDLIRFASVYKALKKAGVAEALRYVHASRDDWGIARRRLAEAALTDLTGKLQAAAGAPETGITGRPTGLTRDLLFDCAQSYYSF
ncbi:hypothetical protein AWM70_14175 [Paenibacillus yonginensis]|uniref:Uncharacterized protein n=1 Tax=Paenibacillus yonginensis TaxID=1462996 RepID=A0A1B1N2F4_9BACL|nr:hypothetical protein [Paenibacillus yonginensis]ANS75598.1 hypothetical protein AWM70_14175 [Paenibacillus yonginensis]